VLGGRQLGGRETARHEPLRLDVDAYGYADLLRGAIIVEHYAGYLAHGNAAELDRSAGIETANRTVEVNQEGELLRELGLRQRVLVGE
jgi:hypothetical protein